MRYSRFLLYFFCFLVISCGTTSMLMTVTRPAEVNLKGYEKIAIGDIVNADGNTGSHAMDLADDFTTALLNANIFEVLDRQHLNSVMSEHELGLSGLIDESTSAELGKIIGAAVLVFGRVQTDKYDEETSKGDPYTDKKGNRHQYHYRKGTYSLVVNIKLIDIVTSKILASKTLAKESISSTSADNKWPANIDVDALYTYCLRDVSKQFMRTVGPYDVQVKASFQTDKLLPEVDSAIAQLKIGEWEEAISQFQQATEKKDLEAKISAKTFYDLGLAQMYYSQYDESLESLKKAFSLMPKSKFYMTAINTCKAEKEKADKLKEQTE